MTESYNLSMTLSLLGYVFEFRQQLDVRGLVELKSESTSKATDNCMILRISEIKLILRLQGINLKSML